MAGMSSGSAAPVIPPESTPEALDAPVLQRRLLGLGNRLSVKRRPIAFTAGEAVLAFQPAGLASPPAALEAGLIGIGLRIGGDPGILRLSADLFERLLQRIEPELLAADLHDDMLPLLLEACIGEALEAGERVLAGRIELTSIQRNMAAGQGGVEIALDLFLNGDDAGRAWLHVEEAMAARLATVFAESPPMRLPIEALKAELRLRAATMWLRLGELRSLKPGDVLLADEESGQPEEIAATLGEMWLLNGTLGHAGLTVTTALRPAAPKDRDLWMMSDDKPTLDDDETPSAGQANGSAATAGSLGGGTGPDADPARSQASKGDAGFDDVPIRLVFELGRVEIDLGKLQALGPGHVFELDRSIGEAVEVFAGGRRIGLGEVVKIDRQVGVRMVRLFGHG